jgi:hypothetical protein
VRHLLMRSFHLLCQRLHLCERPKVSDSSWFHLNHAVSLTETSLKICSPWHHLSLSMYRLVYA